MVESQNIIVKLFWAMALWIQEEGVGFSIYFTISAVMDNATIYVVDEGKFCEYTKQVALYLMALITFLPNVFVALALQRPWYVDGDWCTSNCKKSMFLLLMVVCTIASFFFRLVIVYTWGWIECVDSFFDRYGYQVVIAISVPPLVDLLQSILLIFAGIKGEAHTYQAGHKPLPAEDP